ncbi:hypothetical protein ABB37_06954 [Leptomonas pyrrhocoris]|uniref:Uncharacterized protein n=1 Tax=Leptomonas pyrrhocoris TaxID=157538 RepID=A0A0M9FWM7_LEPPY|nr:hypothetical protein ABB37_06954 [Leptomonas pyrrhocoris]KPA77585.1 hypothetical protein ABB37_06954 [Leptomonas pyrrhocoris]|eukprot:XP_015656024.1 hypothetical protein ABB37_06954 [Leptomonas pyrrhocoris]
MSTMPTNEQDDVQPDNGQQEQTAVTATPNPHLPLGESAVSVLLDEEDSYRVVWEHDEHLARIRAYTDFFDILTLLHRAANGIKTGRGEGPRSESCAAGMDSPNPRAPPPPSSADRFSLRSESGQMSPFTSVDRQLILATAPPQSFYEAASAGAIDPRWMSRLEAERARLAQELEASRDTIQQLQASLQAAQQSAAARADGDAKSGDDVVDVTPRQGAARPPLHPPLASPSSVSSLTSSASRARSTTPRSESVPDAATGADNAPSEEPSPPQQQQGPAELERSITQPLVSPPPPPSYSPPQGQHQPSWTRPQRSGGSSSLSGHGGTPSPPQKPVDVSDFFWTLRVAPPPSDLHEHCADLENCDVTAALRTPPPDADITTSFLAECGGGGYRHYGATTTTAASTAGWRAPPAQIAAMREEEVALACESAWVDSNFYCYNILEEMSCLRVVPSWEDVAGDAATSKPPGSMTEEEMARLLLGRTPTTGRSSATTAAGPTSAAVPPAGSSPETTTLFGGNGGGAVGGQTSSAASQRYRLPYLQRLWVTSVLRQYLLFLLLTITCVLLLIPGMVLGTVNVFEAAEGDDFYATRNRFGRSSLLVVARLGAGCLVFLFFFGFVGAAGGRRDTAAAASVASSGDWASTSLPAAGSDTASNTALPSFSGASMSRPLRATPVGTLVHGVLCLGAALLFAGSLLFSRGCALLSLPLALLGMAVYGTGEALVLGGVSTVVSAEVGVAAGVNVGLQILLSNWLLVNAFGCFVLPKMNYYVYSAAQLLRAQVYTTATIGAFVFGLVMLCSRDLIERAAHANARFMSPRKLLAAARHDVSLCFYLRALTVGLLTAGVVLVLVAGVAVFVPPPAEAASISESAKTKDLMGTGTGKRNTADTATDAGLIAGSMDRWSSQQRHASFYLFAAALLFVPLCFIPRLATIMNRWCPVVLMTTLLCVMWFVSTASSWATVLGLSLSPSNSNAAPASAAGKVADWLWKVWIWTGKHHLFNPPTQLCGVVTGIIYTIVVSSLLRSIANAGVQFPVLHPARWRMAFHERDRRRLHDSFSSHSPTESSPFLTGGKSAKKKEGSTDASVAAEAECPAAATDEDQFFDEKMRCVRMQLRGGPAVMTVLAALLIMIVLISCVTVAMVAAALLTDRSENPVYVNAVMPGVTWDEHLLVKTVLASVFGVAMAVQWVEVFQRTWCSCCC